MIEKVEGYYDLSGVFTKDTVSEHEKSLQTSFKKMTPTVLNLEGVEQCDSAFVALLISIKHDYSAISLKNAPSQLIKLFKLYNVKDWFELN